MEFILMGAADNSLYCLERSTHMVPFIFVGRCRRSSSVVSRHSEAKSLFKQQFQLSFVSNANERGYNKGLYPSFNNVLFNINRMAFFPAVVLK